MLKIQLYILGINYVLKYILLKTFNNNSQFSCFDSVWWEFFQKASNCFTVAKL